MQTVLSEWIWFYVYICTHCTENKIIWVQQFPYRISPIITTLWFITTTTCKMNLIDFLYWVKTWFQAIHICNELAIYIKIIRYAIANLYCIVAGHWICRESTILTTIWSMIFINCRLFLHACQCMQLNFIGSIIITFSDGFSMVRVNEEAKLYERMVCVSLVRKQLALLFIRKLLFLSSNKKRFEDSPNEGLQKNTIFLMWLLLLLLRKWLVSDSQTPFICLCYVLFSFYSIARILFNYTENSRHL